MALHAGSTEIARRRLTQSEAALRASFGPQRRDPYVYQALAELYLGWAQRSSVPEEVAEYVTRAEDTIREGLVKARDRDGLWLVSAKIEEFLGNRPEAFEALERAVRENPKSLVARYLLGRAYFRAREWTKVIDVLKTVLEEEPQEYRAAVVYAKALERVGEPYAQSVAVLRLADLYGRRDARFIATLGGMLTMQGEFTAASAMFATSRESVTYRELNRIEYEPRLNDRPALRLQGTVVKVHAGYAFVQCPGYPDFFLPARSFGSVNVHRGLKVTFKPAFTARGGVAVDIREDGDTSEP
jgi:tetratricopeptide (TPR) repeat protein